MVTLMLSAEEADVVRQALTGYHTTLLLELAKADTRHFREVLRMREALIASVLGRLMPVATP